MTRLGDVVKIEASSKSVVGDKFWLLNLDMVEQQTGNVIDYNYVGKDALNGSIIQFDTGCVLYSKLRPNLNKVVIPDQDGFATSEMLPLRPNTKMLTREYLTAFLRSDSFVTWAVSKTAGAKMPRLGTKELLSKEITLPSISEQIHIAGQFAKVDELIVLRKEQLAKLNQLVKSRFVELFGDPQSNPHGYEYAKLADIATYFNGLTYKPENVADEGTIVLRSSNIQNSQLDFADTVRVDCAIKERLMVQENDILMCSRNGSAKLVGKVALIKGIQEPMSFGAFMMIIRSQYFGYLMTYFQMDAFRQQIKTGATTTINQITGRMLDEVTIPVPPKALVGQFAAFVEQTDKSKLAIQQSLDKLELLKKSLMQEYFG